MRNAAAVVLDASQCKFITTPESDIDTCVLFSINRFVFSLIGFLLVMTDIPRTGLALRNLSHLLEAVGPDSVMNFGPYAYPMVQVNRSEDGDFFGVSDGAAVEKVELWPYKYDTVSVPQRALAYHLDVSSYPDCLKNDKSCPFEYLDISTVFNMLDGLITSLYKQYFQRDGSNSKVDHPPFQFETKSRWIDRLHHYLVRFLWHFTEIRFHTINYYEAKSLQLQTHICATYAGSTIWWSRPYVCDIVYGWECDNPVDAKGTQVPIWTHIALRIAVLKNQYPHLELDLTMITTRMTTVSRHRPSFFFPAVYYAMDSLEVTTFIRGRKCNFDGLQRTCETQFIDDYRYERAILETDADKWYTVISALRATGQGYIWLRMAFLWIGCYHARAAEMKHRGTSMRHKIGTAWITFFKIPSHVVVYGSWFPLVCYVLAHYFDSPLTHVLSDNTWQSVHGYVHIDLMMLIRVTSIQMRNIWLLAFASKVLLTVCQYIGESRSYDWNVCDGLNGIRGSLITGISMLTMFGFYRSRYFRDTSITGFQVLPPRSVHNDQQAGFKSFSEFGIRLDVKMLCIAIIIATVAIILAHFLLALIVRKRSIAWFCRSYYLPYSAGKLWPKESLAAYWRIDLRGSRIIPRHYLMGKSKVAAATLPSEMLSSSLLSPTLTKCQSCYHNWSTWRWQKNQGCPNHDNLLDIVMRTKAQWSIVFLMNIALMTDPCCLIYLYGMGHRLFIYQVNPQLPSATRQDSPRRDATESGMYILPCTPEELEQSFTTDFRCDPDIMNEYKILGDVDSSSLPWSVLVTCG